MTRAACDLLESQTALDVFVGRIFRITGAHFYGKRSTTIGQLFESYGAHYRADLPGLGITDPRAVLVDLSVTGLPLHDRRRTEAPNISGIRA